MKELSLEAFQYYEDHPIEFCSDLLGMKLDKWQQEATLALRDDHFVAIRSGSGIGKSVWLSAMAMWFLGTKPFSKIPCTAPSKHQLEDVLWGEIYKRIQNSPFMQELVTWTQTKVAVKRYEPSWYAVARTARVSPDGTIAEGLQGFHCLSSDTEVLTELGWRFISDITMEDKVLSLIPDSKIAAYAPITDVIENVYTGWMYKAKHQSLDFLITPNHKIPYRTRTATGGFSALKLDEIQNVAKYSIFYIEDTFKWTGDDYETFDIPAFYSIRSSFPAKTVDAKTWFKFLGLFLAEGHARKDGRRVMISQRGTDVTYEIMTLIKKLGFEPHLDAPREDIFMISIYSRQLCEHLKDFGDLATTKRLLAYVRNASVELIQEFLEGYALGDGTINKNGARVFYTSSRELAGHLQELIFKIGRKGSVLEYEVPDSIIRDKEVTNCANRFVVTEYIRTNPVSITSDVNLEQIWCDKMLVYCLTVPPYHTFFTRRNGFCMWSGNSEENLLFIIDEASGVADAVFPAMEGALTGQSAYAILTGNPTRLSGYFHSVFNDLKMRSLYHLFHVSCYDSAYVDERYLRMMEARYGKDHPIFQIKVLGDFPSSDIFLLFPIEDVEVMKNNRFEDIGPFNPNAPKEIGVDIGRSIAKSVACTRQENRIIDWSERGLRGTITDVVEVAEWVIALIMAFEPVAVKIDAAGIGAGVYDIVKRLYPKITKPVLGNASPEESKKQRYVNLRAQGFWELRDVLRTIHTKKLPDALLDEMTDIRYKLKGDKILIESKEEMIKRIGRSPDYTDAMVYAFLNPDICVDTATKYHIPYLIKGMNESMKKTNVWEPSDTQSLRSNKKFGALHA